MGPRHQRLKTQIHLDQEQARNKESLINHKDLNQMAPPNSEIKQKISRFQASKRGDNSEDHV